MKHVTKRIEKTTNIIKKFEKILLLVCSVLFLVGADLSVAQAAAKLNMTDCTFFVGDQVELTVTGYKGRVTWKSSKDSVTSVVGGYINAKKAGKATITARCGSKSLKCKVTVLKEKKYSNASNTLILSNGLMDSQAFVGDVYDFAEFNNGSYFVYRYEEKVYDEEGYDEDVKGQVVWNTYDAENQELITWSSSNESVAKVTQEGLVFFNKPGCVTITAKTASKQAKIGFNVRSSIPPVSEKRNILQAVAKKLKKAGAKKVVLGVPADSEEWTEYEQSVYSQVYGGKKLSKAAYLQGRSGFTTVFVNENDLAEEFLKEVSGKTVTIYYMYANCGGLMEVFVSLDD